MNKKQRIDIFAKKLIERTLYHRRNDVGLLQNQIEVCEKWGDEFFDAAEKSLNNEDNSDE